MAEPLLSHEFLGRLDQLRLAPRQPARGHAKGLHRSNRTGAGMEFTDYRPYSEGDDLKSVDWRSYLRLNRLLVRLFVEEADLPVYLFLDTSASMGIGVPSKFEYGRKVAAALAHIGFINMDRVSLIAVAGGAMRQLSGLRGKNQSWSAFEFLEKLAPAGTTTLAAAFRRYFSAPRARGLIVVISDFLDPAGFEPALRILRNLRQDVLALHLISPEELQPPAGDVVLVDAEDGSTVSQHITPALVEAYREAFENHCGEISAFCNRNAFAYVRAGTDTDFEHLVLQVLRKEGLIR